MLTVHRRPSRPRATLLVALLLFTLAVAALLAAAALDEVRAHQATAERALRDYAAYAARGVLADADADLDRTLGDAFAPVAAAKAASPYEVLPGPEAIAASSAGVLPCPTAGPRIVFRVDLRDGSVATAGDAAPPAMRAWLAAALPAHARAEYVANARYAALFGTGDAAGWTAVYGMKYAPFGAPVGAYGFVTCPAAFARYFAAAAGAAPAGGAPLLALAVTDSHGHPVSRGAGWPVAGDTLERRAFRGFVVRAALAAGARQRLVVGRPGSRLPALLTLLGLTAALALVGLAQLRREQELTRLRADFTSSVSHELRTPLTQILLFGETLSLGRARTDDDRQLAAETIVQETRRLMHMVENVLHHARAERGVAAALAPRDTALGPLVRGVVANFAPLAAAAGAHVTAAADESLVVRADPAAVTQVVLNLLDNAVKYGPRGGTVRVGAARAGGRARLWVEDAGPGVPARERERVWEAYVRLAPVGTATPGSGLGLSVVRELVRRSGGEAWVEAGARGGARFVVELPLSEGAAGTPDEEGAWRAC